MNDYMAGEAYARAALTYLAEPADRWLGQLLRVHGATATTNIDFGGDDWKTLYFTSRNHLGMTKVKIPGIPVPVK